MKFDESLKIIYEKYNRNVLFNSFLMSSILSDYIGNSFQDLIYLKIFFKLTNEDNLINILEKNSLRDARKILENVYKNKYTNLCSSRNFVEAINPISKLIHPSEYEVLKKKKTLEKKDEIACVKPPKIKHKNIVKVEPKKVDCQRINLYVSCDTFTLKYSDKNEFSLYNDGILDKYFNPSRYMTRDTLNVNIMGQNKSIVLEIPKKKYKFVAIKAQPATIKIPEPIDATKMIIKNDFNNSYISANCNTFEFQSLNKSTILSYKGTLRNLKGIHAEGETTFDLVELKKGKTHLNFYTNKGITWFNLRDFELKPRINKLFGKTKEVNTTRVSDLKEIEFELNSKNGDYKITNF